MLLSLHHYFILISILRKIIDLDGKFEFIVFTRGTLQDMYTKFRLKVYLC